MLEHLAAEQPLAPAPLIALANHWIDVGQPLRALAALAPVPDEARSDPVVLFLTGLAQFARTDTERACEQLLAAVKGG